MIGFIASTIPSYKSAEDYLFRYESAPTAIYQTYSGDFPCPPEYYGNTFRKSMIKYSDIIPFSFMIKGDEEKLNPEYIKRGQLYAHFLESFAQHDGKLMPVEASKEFEYIAELLSELPVRESLVQYSCADSMIDFLLVLNDGIRLSVGKFTDEDDIDEIVEFSVYDNRKLILSGETTIEQLVKKLRRIHKIPL